VLRGLVRAERWLTAILKAFGILLIVVMLGVVCLGIVTRYFVQYPLPWTDEAARFLLVWASFLGAAIGVREGLHFEVDLLVRILAPALQRGTRLVAQVAVLTLGGTLLYTGLVALRSASTQTSPGLQISMTIPYSIVPVSGGLMVLYVVLAWIGVLPEPGRRDAPAGVVREEG
jgi:TRAP-type C4-dicarboxylate transport system permease small subunit